MAKFKFTPGVPVRIENDAYVFVERGSLEGQPTWYLRAVRSGIMKAFPLAELRRLYDNGLLVHDPGQQSHLPGAEAREKRRQTRISELPEPAKARFHRKRQILEKVEERIGTNGLEAKITLANGRTVTLLDHFLPQICTELGFRPISRRTFWRWRKERTEEEGGRGLLGNYSRRGRKPIHPTVRRIIVQVMTEALQQATDREVRGRSPTTTMKMMIEAVGQHLDVENLKNPAQNLSKPSKSTFYNIWKEAFTQYQRDLAKYGRVRTRTKYRSIHGHAGPEAPLDIVEYDETRLPCFFFDDITMVPLGRAWLSWWLDVYSHTVVGFYLGFEPAGDLTIASSLHHACVLKSYVRDEYPYIEHEYIPGGVPRLGRLDNGLAQWGRTLEGIADDLDMFLKFTPARTPWFKPIVEGTFEVLNRLLLQELPGFVLGHGKIHPDDYDPASNGCIGLLHFLAIFHKWLVDQYHVGYQDRLKASPNDRWLEGTKTEEPSLLDRSADLDLLFGIIREGRLDHRGVVYKNIRYNSSELDLLRRDCGHTIKNARVKVNPSDLAKIHVWHPKAKLWVPAKAYNEPYAKGLSLHRHELNDKCRRERGWEANEDAYLRAEMELRALIAASVEDALSIRESSLIARYFGFGTHNIFNHLDHNGRLAALTGTYAGQKLDPFSGGIQQFQPGSYPTPPEASTLKSTVPPDPMALATLSPVPHQAVSSMTPKQSRNIPVFFADHSLRRRSPTE